MNKYIVYLSNNEEVIVDAERFKDDGVTVSFQVSKTTEFTKDYETVAQFVLSSIYGYGKIE